MNVELTMGDPKYVNADTMTKKMFNHGPNIVGYIMVGVDMKKNDFVAIPLSQTYKDALLYQMTPKED